VIGILRAKSFFTAAINKHNGGRLYHTAKCITGST
jgi:hypothetical protein